MALHHGYDCQEYNKKVTSSDKSSRYNLMYLIFPAIAIGSYNLLLAAALLKQHSGVGDINFMFLSFWGLLIFLISLLLSLMGFIRRKELMIFMRVVNVAVSLVIIVLSLSIIFIINNPHPAHYSCNDFVRCVLDST